MHVQWPSRGKNSYLPLTVSLHQKEKQIAASEASNNWISRKYHTRIGKCSRAGFKKTYQERARITMVMQRPGRPHATLLDMCDISMKAERSLNSLLDPGRFRVAAGVDISKDV